MKLYTGGYLTFYMPERRHTLELRIESPTLLRKVLQDLQIPIEEVNLIAINGDLVEIDDAVINDQDVVRIFSSVNGG